MIRTSQTWHETQLQDVVNNPWSYKVLVSKGRLIKVVAEPQDLVQTDGNRSKLWWHSIPMMIRTSPAWHETQLQDVVINPRSWKVQVSKGGLLKLAAKHQDVVPTDGNHGNQCWNAIPKIIRTSPAWSETQLQVVVNNPRSCKVLVSKGRLLKVAAKHQDLVPTDGNHRNECWNAIQKLKKTSPTWHETQL